jgi:hypothetical protein
MRFHNYETAEFAKTSSGQTTREDTANLIGLIAGSKIEAWMPDAALGECVASSENLQGTGQSPPGRLFNGQVAPFVNFTLSGFLWYQVRSSSVLGFACLTLAISSTKAAHWLAWHQLQ